MNGNPPPPSVPPPPPVAPPTGGGGASGKAITSLVLGILSLPALCCGFCTPVGVILGVVALILGRMEEGAIQRGQSSPAGRTMARAGWIMGLIGIILNTVFFVLTLVIW